MEQIKLKVFNVILFDWCRQAPGWACLINPAETQDPSCSALLAHILEKKYLLNPRATRKPIFKLYIPVGHCNQIADSRTSLGSSGVPTNQQALSHYRDEDHKDQTSKITKAVDRATSSIAKAGLPPGFHFPLQHNSSASCALWVICIPT